MQNLEFSKNPNRFSNPPLAKIGWVYLLSFAVTITFLFAACEKETSPIQAEQVPPLKSMGNGNAAGYDINWLIGFQTYLRNVQNNTSANNIYSAEDAVNGVEALLNIRYTNDLAGTAVYFPSNEFNVPTNSNWLDLLNMAKANLLADIAANTDPDLSAGIFDVSIDTVIGNTIRVRTMTIFKDNSTCVVNNYITTTIAADCEDVFGEDEAYLLGLDGFNQPAWNPDCLNECGDYIPCQNEPGYAMEEIEKHLNANFPDPVCEGACWDGTYSDVQTKWFWVDCDDWINSFPDCSFDEAPKACTCMESELLNCLYCTLFEAFDTGVPSLCTIDIPDGYHFISTNLGVDYLFFPLPYDQLPTQIYGSYTYGIPNCKPCIGGPGPWVHDVLYIDLTEYL